MNAGFRCGYIALVGRPNVGKSTLLNRILGQKISITSRRPQTTRHRVLGIKTLPHAQLIYVDTPGIHDFNGRAMNRYMNRTASSVLADVDVVVFLVEGLRWTADDELVLNKLAQGSSPVILEEARLHAISIPQERFEADDFPSITTPDLLRYDIDDQDKDSQKKSIVKIANDFLNITKDFDQLKFYESYDHEAILAIVPDKVNEVEIRRYEMLLHSLQSSFDTYVIHGGFRYGNRKLKQLRGFFSVVFLALTITAVGPSIGIASSLIANRELTVGAVTVVNQVPGTAVTFIDIGDAVVVVVDVDIVGQAITVGIVRRIRIEVVGRAVVIGVVEGTRALIVEIQALTGLTNYAVPQRSSTGVDRRRLPLILAVLERRGGLSLGNRDIFVNVAGGVYVAPLDGAVIDTTEPTYSAVLDSGEHSWQVQAYNAAGSPAYSEVRGFPPVSLAAPTPDAASGGG